MTMHRESLNSQVRTRQNNINRYGQLLATRLTDREREYLHRRIVEERLAIEALLKEAHPERRHSAPAQDGAAAMA